MKFLKTITVGEADLKNVQKFRFPSGKCYFNNLRLGNEQPEDIIKKIFIQVNGYDLSQVENKSMKILKEFYEIKNNSVPLYAVSGSNYLSANYENIQLLIFPLENMDKKVKITIDVYQDDEMEKNNVIEYIDICRDDENITDVNYIEFRPNGEKWINTTIEKFPLIKNIVISLADLNNEISSVASKELTVDTEKNFMASVGLINEIFSDFKFDKFIDLKNYKLKFRINFKETVKDDSLKIHHLHLWEKDVQDRGEKNVRIRNCVKKEVEYIHNKFVDLYYLLVETFPGIIFGPRKDDGIYGIVEEFNNVKKVTIYEKKTIPVLSKGYLYNSVTTKEEIKKLYVCEQFDLPSSILFNTLINSP